MRTLTSFCGAGAALVLCAVSAAINYLFLSSLGKTPLEGHVLGAASAAADLLKALLPFYIAWSWQARRFVAAVAGSLAFTFFAGFSLLSAIGFAADTRGALVDAREGIAQEYAGMQRAIIDAEARRKALPAHRPAAIVSEEIKAHRQSRRWSATKACTNATEAESREFCTAYFRLRAELAAAKEAEQLAGQIAGLQAESAKLREKGAEQDSDPQVTLVSRISGLNTESVRLALIVAVALLVEIGASLGLFLAAGHGLHGCAEGEAPDDDGGDPAGMVEDFSLEALVPSRAAVLSAHDLEQGYRRWCAASGRTPLRAEAFGAVFAELSAIVGIARVQGGWRGIALKHDKAALDMVS